MVDPELPAADPMVMAIPRKDLFRINGFVSRIDVSIIELVAEDAWYTAASTLIDNLDAKEVRLGLVIERGDQVLIDEAGNVLHTTRLGPEVATLGGGLKALRELASLAGGRFVGCVRARGEMAGYLNDDSLPEHRHAFFLVYRCRVGDDALNPPGTAWVGKSELGRIPLEPLSLLTVGGLFPGA